MSDEMQESERDGAADRRGERGCLRALGRERAPSGPRPRAERRMWRDVVDREGREEHTRVVPLPFALAAVLLPFLAAWASAGSEVAPERASALALRASSNAPMESLGRFDRAPARSRGYVDVWRAAEPWEVDALRRRGYVRPERRAGR
ncbi:MAG: hypothetical protein AAGB93_13530 [Planctomycetota bacterium]